MTLENLRLEIAQVINAARVGAEFYFLLDAEGEVSIKRADIDARAQDELKADFIDSISSTILRNNDLALLDLSSADDRLGAIYKYDLAEVPPRLAHLAEVLERDDFELFDFTSDDLSHLVGVLVLIGHGPQQLALYKHQYPVALLRRDGPFSLVRLRNQNRMVKLEGDVLRINSKFEFMRMGGEYYIVDIKALERFFGFHDAVRNVALEGIANIERVGLLESVASLSERVEDITFSRKLVRAATASPVLGKIPNAEVIKFVTSHPALRGKIKVNDSGDKLRLNTKVSQDLFLKLLNDSFLQSQLTKLYYESLAKDALVADA